MLLIVLASAADGLRYETLGRILPFILGGLGLILILPLMYKQATATEPDTALCDRETNSETEKSEWYYLGWIAAMLGFMAIVGYPIGAMIFIWHFIHVKVGKNHLRNGLMGLSAPVFLGILAYALTLEYPPGLLQEAAEVWFGWEMPFWLGGPQ